MWNQTDIAAFKACVKDLLNQPMVLEMDRIDQHVPEASCLDHSLYVAYVSYRVCRRLHLDYRAAARGGLLHDLYLYDWRSSGPLRIHLRRHPAIALQNAEKLCPLSDRERDIIEKHMWPLTARPPRYRESLIVSTADKLCAALEQLHLYRRFHVGEHLNILPRRAAASSHGTAGIAIQPQRSWK